MTSPAIDPLRLNVAHFAADALEAEGDWAIAELPRLADSECPVDAGSPLKPQAGGAEPPARADSEPPVAAGSPLKPQAGGAKPLTRAESDLARRVRWRAVGST